MLCFKSDSLDAKLSVSIARRRLFTCGAVRDVVSHVELYKVISEPSGQYELTMEFSGSMLASASDCVWFVGMGVLKVSGFFIPRYDVVCASTRVILSLPSRCGASRLVSPEARLLFFVGFIAHL